MTWAEYKTQAMRTANGDLDKKKALRYCLFKLAGEVGEVADAYGKYLGQGHSKEWLKDKLTEELGDVYWYLAYYEALTGKGMCYARPHWDTGHIEHLIEELITGAHRMLSFRDDWGMPNTCGKICGVIDVTKEEIWQRNIEKLRHRYPEGFDPDRSKMRYEVEGQIG